MKIIKKYLHVIVLTFCIDLLPLILGLWKGSAYEERIPVYFGRGGTPFNYAVKSAVVYYLPAVLLVIEALCVVMALLETRPDKTTEFLFRIRIWIAPLMAIGTSACLYGYPGGTLKGMTVLLLMLGFAVGILAVHLPDRWKEDGQKTMAKISLVLICLLLHILAFR